MREHDALRPSGAAAGEEDDVRVALVERRLVDRSLDARAGAARRARCGRSRRDVPAFGELAVRGVGDHEARPGVPGDSLGLGGAVAARSAGRTPRRAWRPRRRSAARRATSRPTTRPGRCGRRPAPQARGRSGSTARRARRSRGRRRRGSPRDGARRRDRCRARADRIPDEQAPCSGNVRQRSATASYSAAMTTIYHDDDADLSSLAGASRGGRRLRQPGPLVGAEPARLGLRRAGLRAGRRDARAGRGRRLHARRPRRREHADVVCVLVPDDVIPSLPIAARPTASRSSPAATRSRSTASTPTATSGWSRRACSGPRCGCCYEEGIGFITAVGVHRDVTGSAHARVLAVAKAIGGLAPGRDRADRRCRRRSSTSAVEQALSPALTHGERHVRAGDARAGDPARGDHHRARALGRDRADDAARPRVGVRGPVRVPLADEPVRPADAGATSTTTSTSTSTMRAPGRRHRVGPLRRRVGRRARRRVPEPRSGSASSTPGPAVARVRGRARGSSARATVAARPASRLEGPSPRVTRNRSTRLLIASLAVTPADELTARFRDHGLRVTPQRQVIFRLLHGNDEHPTVEALYDAGPRRDADDLAEDRVPDRPRPRGDGRGPLLDLGTGSVRVDPNVEHPHHHLICTRCGRVRDVLVDVGDLRIPARERRRASPSTTSRCTSAACAPTAASRPQPS